MPCDDDAIENLIYWVIKERDMICGLLREIFVIIWIYLGNGATPLTATKINFIVKFFDDKIW